MSGNGSSTDSALNVPIISFLSCQSEKKTFGSIRVPNKFNRIYGDELNMKPVTIYCKEGYMWNGTFLKDKGRIDGLRDFLLAHEVTMYNMLLFDYMGKLCFNVRTYNQYTLEADYTKVAPAMCRCKNFQKCLAEEEYVVGVGIVSKAKANSLMLHNSCAQHPWHSLRIEPNHLVEKPESVVLHKAFKEIYKNWKSGDIIGVRIGDRFWNIQVENKDGEWKFCNGWSKFANNVRLSEGDTLCLHAGDEAGWINATIFKPMNEKLLPNFSGHTRWSVSFYFFFTRKSILATHSIILPKYVYDHYKPALEHTVTLSCGGKKFDFKQFWNGGDIFSIRNFLLYFEIDVKDSAFCVFDSNGTANVKLFYADGVEFIYGKSRIGTEHNFSKQFYIHEVWHTDKLPNNCAEDEEKKTENEQPNGDTEIIYISSSEEDGNNMSMDEQNVEMNFVSSDEEEEEEECEVFTRTLVKSNVNKSCHGPSFPVTMRKRDGSTWVPGDWAKLLENDIKWPVKIIENNGGLRFSARWNEFADDHELKKGDQITFFLNHEIDNCLTFYIERKRRY